MRIRIALSTAVAVLAIPVITIATLSAPTSATNNATHRQAIASRHTATRHEAVALHRGTKAHMQLTSYLRAVHAQNQAQLASYLTALNTQREAAYLTALNQQRQAAFLGALQAQKDAAARAAAARAAAAAPAPAAVPVSAPAGASADASSTNTADWECIRFHESRDNYTDGNGGAYQFEFGTWHALTGLPAPAQDYPASVQDAAALKLYSERGWEPWTTRYVCGL